MKIRTGLKLPSGIDKDLGFSLTQLFGEVARAHNDLETNGLDTKGTVIVDDAATGIVLKDTQATPHYWRVTVSNTGVLTTTDLGTTKP